MDAAQKLPLHSRHVKFGAKMGNFGGWDVPLYYSSILEEHEAVRSSVGVFDISHMGEILIEGPRAKDALNLWLTNQLDKISAGKALYSPVCNEQGGIVDDVVVYQLGEERYLIIVNASNTAKDLEWFQRHNPLDVRVTNISDEFGLLSVQGPRSYELLKLVFSSSLSALSYYSFAAITAPWDNALIARTGYTGELGYEILLETGDLEDFYDTVLLKGASLGVKPVGFGARDTLRLEAKMLLYGQDMTDETTPLEAGLGWAVDFEKDEFIGHEIVKKQKEFGVSRKLVGFVMQDRGIPRHGHSILHGTSKVGEVTSGSFSPTLKQNIGLAYIAREFADVDRDIAIDIRGQAVKAKVVKTPFYRNAHMKELV